MARTIDRARTARTARPFRLLKFPTDSHRDCHRDHPDPLVKALLSIIPELAELDPEGVQIIGRLVMGFLKSAIKENEARIRALQEGPTDGDR